MTGKNDYDVAAYIWPSYTGREPRSRIFWPRGIGEWETVEKRMHQKPLWGMRDEADPAVMEHHIEQALKHGVNTFIYDWYWYDDRPFLEMCLNDGFLGAPNNGKMKFYVMWANHTATTLWDLRTSHADIPIWNGAVNLDIFKTIARRWMEQYFLKENYYRIDGKPVLSIFDTGSLLRGLGGEEATARAFDWLREELVKSGFGGLHLQLVKMGGENVFPLARAIAADSITHYQTACYTKAGCDYSDWLTAMRQEFDMIDSHGILYFPHVSMGWGSQPRFLKPKNDDMTNCTPENIKQALLIAKDYIDTHRLSPPLVTLNSWNEWTETSYLQPDDVNGYGYLEAVREVFHA
ncbi:MAG: glycoside hydrolase family 99-like domain-containing protein [Firmicutes bacterium]|nr:glycoside hydrolase family 99-like domain-containing protein [Bacillota bacterium]